MFMSSLQIRGTLEAYGIFPSACRGLLLLLFIYICALYIIFDRQKALKNNQIERNRNEK